MSTAALRFNPLQQIQLAIRKPEQLALHWQDEKVDRATFTTLALSATASLSIYGLTMGLPHGLHSMLAHAVVVPLCALLAWSLCFPALYVLNTSLGAPMTRGTTAFAALTALHFGALARLASAPLSWFFGLTVHADWALTGLHLLVFGATALCMADVFLRVMKKLNPEGSRLMPFLWLCLVALIDVELKLILSVFAL